MVDITAFFVEATDIDGLLVMQVKEVRDERGVIREFFRASAFADEGVADIGTWQQMNLTESRAGAIRGLHGEAMNKLVGVVSGEAFGAYVDVRKGSPTIGVVATVRLTIGTQVLVPKGVCNGFQSVTDTQYFYAFDNEWVPGMPGAAVCPMDPALNIAWPVAVDMSTFDQVSEKDANAPTLVGMSSIARTVLEIS